MAADPQRQEASSNDLFGRWLAHHNEQQTAENGEQTESAEDTSGTAPDQRASRRLPAAAVASSAVERDPVIGSRIAPPSTFGVRKSAANAPQKSGPGNELDREPPTGWEPIVMRSIRKKTEQAEAKQVPKPVDTRSRLQRLKARLVDPVEPEPEVEIPLVPLTPPVARSVPLPAPTPKPALPTRSPAPSAPDAPAAPVARSLEETIRAAVPTIERQVARHAEPRGDEQPVVEQPAVEQPAVEQPAVEQPVVEQPVEQVRYVGRRRREPEDVAPPTPVRAFIDAAPVITEQEPEPVAVDPEPYVEPNPEPVAESVVVEAEPEPLDLAESAPIFEQPEPVAMRATEAQENIEPTEPAEPTEDQPARFAFLSLPRRQPKEPMAVAEPAPVIEPFVEPVIAPSPVATATIEVERELVQVPATTAPENVESAEAAKSAEPAEPSEDPPARRSFLSLPKSQPKEPEPAPEPMALAEPAPVVEPVIEPEQVQVQATEAPENIEPAESAEPAEPTEDQPARRSFLSLPKRQPKEPKPRESGREDRPGTGDAARDQVAAAKARARATSPAPQAGPVAPPAAQETAQEAVQSSAVAVAAPPEPEVEAAPHKVSKHDEVATEMPGLYKFAAKRTSRRLLTISLLIGAVASAYFVRAALEVKDTPSIGLAAIVVLATVMVWAIRGGASVTTLEVHQGQLQVIQQGGRFIFDLSSQYTRFEVHGQPGHRRWKVLFPRRGMEPFTVDASMVDPDDFMRVLRFFRPQLVHH